MDKPFEFYLLAKPILGCRNAFPVRYSRYRYYHQTTDQKQWLREQYEIFYDEPATNQDETYFGGLSVYLSKEAAWFYTK